MTMTFIFESKGKKIVRFYPGRKLDYEPKSCSKGGSETEFLTAIEFSEEHPFGKAIAVLNWKSGYLGVAESWFILHGIVLSYILSNVMKREEVQEQLEDTESFYGYKPKKGQDAEMESNDRGWWW